MNRKIILTSFKNLIIIIMIAAIIFPIYWMVVTSLRAPEEIFSTGLNLFLKNIYFENYIEVFRQSNILRYALNSLFITSTTVVLVLLIASLSAYAVSRFEFKGKKLYFIAIVATQMMPGITFIISIYLFWMNLGMLNTYHSIILTYVSGGSAVATWLLINYFNSIPKDIDEAATIDGASRLRILFVLIMPLARPGLMAVGLSNIIGSWQELMVAMTLTTNDSMKTLPVGIRSFITSNGILWGPLTAAGVVVCIPIIIAYFFLQKHLVNGLTSGATKG